MKTYKIVEKKYLDYRGDECSKFYIKKRVLGIFWFYAQNHEDDVMSKVLTGALGVLMGILINLIFLLPFMITNFASPILLPLWIYGFYLGQRVSNIMERDSFYSLSDAEHKLKNIIKLSRYKNKTIDVLEVSTSKDKLIMEKKN